MAVLAALGSGFCFALMQIVFQKTYREQGVGGNPLALARLLGLLFPVWVAVLWGGFESGAPAVHWGAEALRWAIIWAVCSALTTTGLVWLLGRFSLSEVTAYKKALLTAGALAADMLIFKVGMSWQLLLAVGLLLGASLGLSGARSRLPTRAEWAVMLVWCGVLVLQVTAYKTGQGMQPSVLAFTVLAQALVTGIYALLWLIPAVRRIPVPREGVVLLIVGLVGVGTLVEGFAYKALPLSVVLLATLAPAALMSAHDLWRGLLPRNARVGVSLAALAGGFLVLILGR